MTKLPDFIVIGCQRGGTTSLYNYITSHPDVGPASQKEIHYFDNNYEKGLDWYREQFPENKVTGEASPYYIIHPHSPQRIKTALPKIKIIALLRNPIERAYSHFQHEVRLGTEKLSFQEAIEKEPHRLKGELEKMYDDEKYYSFAHQHFTYIERGKYIKQLKKWFNNFEKNQLLILKSETLFEDTDNTMKRVFEFLELSNRKIKNIIFNEGKNLPLEEKLKNKLSEYFLPYNEELYSYLGEDFQW